MPFFTDFLSIFYTHFQILTFIIYQTLYRTISLMALPMRSMQYKPHIFGLFQLFYSFRCKNYWKFTIREQYYLIHFYCNILFNGFSIFITNHFTFNSELPRLCWQDTHPINVIKIFMSNFFLVE